jgi:hypothetical protein
MNITTITETIKIYLPTAETYPVLGEVDKVLFRYEGDQYVTDGYTVTENLGDPDFPEVDIDMGFEEALEFIAGL